MVKGAKESSEGLSRIATEDKGLLHMGNEETPGGLGLELKIELVEGGEEGKGLEGTASDETLTSSSSPAPSPPTPTRNYVGIAILFFVNLLNYMDRFTIAGVLKDLQASYGINNSQAGLLQTVFICSYMICAPIFGFLGDRYSRKWIMSFGIFIWSATVLLSTFVPSNNFILFLLCRAVVGVGEASYSTVSPTLIADMFTKDRRSTMLMVFYFAIPVGRAVSPESGPQIDREGFSGLGFVVGSNVAALLGDWRWGLRVTPILGAICLFLMMVVLKEPKRGEAEADSKLQASSWLQDIKHLAHNRSYVWSTLAFTCVAFVAGCLSWWTPNYVIYGVNTTGQEANEAQINLIFGIITCLSGFIGVTIGSTWAQIWRKRNGRADPLVCGIGLFVCVPFLLAGLHLVEINIHATWALMFVAVTGLSLNWAVVSDILLYIVIPPRRATASAMQILLSHLLGDAISPYIVGALSDHLKGGDASAAAEFSSLRYALYIPSAAVVFGGLLFMVAAYYVEGDRRKAELLTTGLAVEEGKALSVTASSRSVDIPTSDSSARLLLAKNTPTTPTAQA